MAEDLTFSIGSETTGFDNGIRRGVIEPLEDAEKAIEDLAKTGDKSLERIEDSMSDARRDTDRFKDEIKDVSDALTRVGRKGKDAGRDIDDGFDRAKKGADEFKDEANSTAREAAASFDGSAESIGDAFQEVAANAFAGFGPAGAAAGLAAAAGLGFAMSAITAQQEEADELKRRLTEAYIAAAEEGRNYLSVQQVIEESGAIYEDTERLAKATADAARLNLDRALVVQAMAGDEEALNAVIAAGNDVIEEGNELRAKSPTREREVSELESIVGRYQEQLGLQTTAQENAREYLELVQTQNQKEAEGNTKARDAINARGRALEAHYKRLASPPAIPVRFDTSQADRQAAELRRRTSASLSIPVTVRVVGQTGPGRFVE